MFDRISDSFSGALRKLSGSGTISEANVREAMDGVRNALLEADVQYEVAETFCKNVLKDALGQEVTKSVKPGQEMIAIVHRRLVELFGGDPDAEQQAPPPGIMKMSPGPTIVMMCGLQGSGKTTTCGKLAAYLKKQNRSVMLAAADLQRPAAVEQLRTLGGQIDVPVFSQPGDPVDTAKAGLDEARRLGRDVLIVDTAGRLAIDEELMEQVRQISEVTSPDYTFLVVDAMTGQDAVTVAESFNSTLALDGVILTKLDGDARGGAALSVKEVVGKPIAFASVGEKLDEFELFHPDRLAGRILGMGDMLTLIEKAEQVYEQQEAEEAAARLMEGTFTLDDFLDQMQQLKKMGPLSGLVGMIPGMPKELKGAQIEDDQIARVEAIIRSMTKAERADVDLIDGSRRARIAKGSGSDPGEVSQLVKQFKEMQKMMKRIPGFSGTKKKGGGRGGKGKKGKKGGRTTAPPTAGTAPPKQPFTLPGLP